MVDALGTLLLTVSLAGLGFVLLGLAQRLLRAGRRWSAGQPTRYLFAGLTALAVLVGLAAAWLAQGQFHGW